MPTTKTQQPATLWLQMLTLLSALALLAAACGSSEEATEEASSTDSACDSSATKTEGVLTVATGQEVYPPWMEDNDPSNGKGFESALVYALADQMGIETVEWTSTGFEEAIIAGEKDYDFNIQQYSINDERDQVVDFSNGYYQVDQAIIGAADSPAASATSLAELAELRLGAAIGTTSLNYIEDVIQPSTDASIYDDNAQATAAFNAGQVDAIVYDLPTAYYITAAEIPEAVIIGILPQEGEPEELGMLFEEGSPLVGCVNDALAALDGDGTWEAIQEEWLYQAGSIPVLTP